MGTCMKRLLRNLVEAAAAPYYRARPVAHWPKRAGDLLGVNVPANLRPKAAASPEGGANVNIIFALLDRTRSVPGDIAECGVFRGNSLAAAALYLRQTGQGRHAFGFDSFRGFDDTIATDLALGGADSSDKRVGGFGETSLASVAAKLRRLGLDRAVTLMPGYFTETLARCRAARFSFVHLDCDIYESYRQTLAHFYPRMAPGGIVLFDEYEDPPWPGCKLAVDEFLADKPERPTLISMNNYEKYYIVKQ
jgi:O-methyltransferase